MNSKIYIGVDGNKDIGLGHIYRGFGIAQISKANIQIEFISKDLIQSIVSLFVSYKFDQNDEFEQIQKIASTEDSIVVQNG